jgi:hypothetical protein
MIRAHVLHLWARAAVRWARPHRAKALVEAMGIRLARLDDASAARRVAASLRGGTCLTRAFTVAALMDGANVVVGVLPLNGGRVEPNARSIVSPRDPSIFAHAWVEHAGEPIDTRDVAGAEIARFVFCARRTTELAWSSRKSSTRRHFP